MAISGSSQSQPTTIPIASPVRRRFRRTTYKRDEVIMGYLFIFFPMAIFVTFFLGAMLFDFWMSFHRWGILDSPTYIGTKNYNYIFRVDNAWWTAIKNTFLYSVLVVPTQTAIAFLLALVVNQNIRGKKFFRTTFYFPSVTSSVAISLLFLYLFNNLGLVNYFLAQAGFTGPNWIGDPSFALKSIMGLNVWTTTGTLMVIFLAALQDVPREVLEAAALDGATGPRAVISIVLPLIRPALFFVVANGLIGTLQIFDQAFVVSGGNGGPENATLTAVLYIYNSAFKDSLYGVAAAGSFVLFVFIFVATLAVRRLLGEGAS